MAEIAVELLDSMGTDLSIINAARVSYSKHSKHLSGADQSLINYLMKNRHGTPFEMVQFKFRVHAPIGVAREWMRHRIGSFNEVSSRYVQMEPNFYIPETDAVRKQVGKPGHYTFEILADIEARQVQQVFEAAYVNAYEAYQHLITVRGVAKELARNVLPLGLFTEFVWSVNLRSLLNFLSLRTAPDALLEIRLAAEQVETLARTIAPVAMTAWDTHGRRSP